MKRILFILPNLSTGGTLSSMIGLLKYIDLKCHIDIFSLTGSSNLLLSINSNLIKSNWFMDCYYSRGNNYSGLKILQYFFVKLVKKCTISRVCCEKLVFKHIAKRFSNKYDTVVAFEEGPATIFGSYIKSPLRCAWVHCDYSRYYNNGRERDIYEVYNKIVCVSRYTAETFKATYPTLAKNVISISNILDYLQINRKAEEIINDELFDKSSFTIISVGRFTKVKRFADIPKVAKQIKDQGYIFKWYILGPINKWDYFFEFQENVNRYDVKDMVFYLGNKSNPYPYFRESDLLVCMSSSEACPMIFNEAKVIGLPIVTTDFPSSFEFITSSFDGLIIDFENLSQAIIRFIKDNLFYSEIKKNIKSKVYTNNYIYHQLDKLFGL